MIFNSVQFNPVTKGAAVGRALEEGMRGLVEEKAAQTRRHAISQDIHVGSYLVFGHLEDCVEEHV